MLSVPDPKCLNAALRLLARRDHGCAELGRKLAQRGFDPIQIAAVLDECKRRAYLDDEKYCHGYTMQQRRKGYGIMRIAQDLREKGLSAECIDDSLRRNCSEEEQIEDCRRVLAKKRNRKSIQSDEKPERLYRFLLNRGFTSTVIARVLEKSMS